MFKVTRQVITSNPPSAVCAGFFTKFGNYWTLLILDNATVNSRHQDPLSWQPIGLCTPSLLDCPTTRYQYLSRGLKAKHMLKMIKKPCQIVHYKFCHWCEKVWADIIAYYEIEMHSFSSQLYKMLTFKNLELSANFIH